MTIPSKTSAIIAMLLALTGCTVSKNSTRYFLLSPISSEDLAKNNKDLKINPTAGVSLIRFPAYLDRPQIVTHISNNRLKFAEYNRWAEPLRDNFSRVLTQNLMALLPNFTIVELPQRQSFLPITYKIEINVARFDVDELNNGRLFAEWKILQTDSNKYLISRISSISVPSKNANYDAIVTALNAGLADLSREIRQALQSPPFNETSHQE